MSYIAKRLLIVLAIAVGVLIVLNPSKKDFDDYVGVNSRYKPVTRRVNNYLIFSIYEQYPGGARYVGVISNFYQR